jgi:hypothetical protein
MDELDEAGLKLFFDEEIYLIDKIEVDKPQNIETPPAQPLVMNEPAIQPLALNYKGGNTKEIAVIITDDSNEFLNNRDETLLLNILNAIGLSLDDVAVINQHISGTTWQDQLDYNKVLVFGILPSTYGFKTDHYNIQQKEDAQWLFSDSLFGLANDNELKGKLWGKLKEMF